MEPATAAAASAVFPAGLHLHQQAPSLRRRPALCNTAEAIREAGEKEATRVRAFRFSDLPLEFEPSTCLAIRCLSASCSGDLGASSSQAESSVSRLLLQRLHQLQL